MKLDIRKLAEDILRAKPQALARGLTLIESSHSAHRKNADKLMNILADNDSTSPTQVLGITGPPGAGKSTLIASLVPYLLEHSPHSQRIAVLTTDPSSPIHGGSLLGDTTRMGSLLEHSGAFIRSFPGHDAPGGIAGCMERAVSLMTYASFNPIILETAGVGQTAFQVAKLCQLLIVLELPGSGDELQAMKKGLLELADLIIVSKNDGQLTQAARKRAHELQSAFSLGLAGTVPVVTTHSCQDDFKETGDIITKLLVKPRSEKRCLEFFNESLCREFLNRVSHEPALSRQKLEFLNQYLSGKLSADRAAKSAIASWFNPLQSRSPTVDESRQKKEKP